MDEALMPVPAGPTPAQPRANATGSFNAVAGKVMRVAKAIVSGNTGFKCMSAERKAVYGAMQRVEYAKRGSRQARESRNSRPEQRERGVLSLVHEN
jgi:hypothetical protein